MEIALRSRLNGNIEMACEAALGIKVILALESRLESLVLQPDTRR